MYNSPFTVTHAEVEDAATLLTTTASIDWTYTGVYV